MADNQNFAALDWVVGEISESLQEARQSLEAFVQNPQDKTRLRFCLNHIHQVNGSLQMIEFFGAALLAEEMEAMVQAMMSGSVADQGAAEEVLMRSILQLPTYLDRVKLKRHDDPLALLPLLNDLRSVRGSTLLSESQFFDPDLTPTKQITGERNPVLADEKQFKAIMMKLRKMFRYSAAAIIKNSDVQDNLVYLKKTVARMYNLTAGTPRRPIWSIALAVAEGLEQETVETSVSMKSLLRELDKEIVLLAKQGVSALESYSSDELIKSALFYVARCEASTPRIERIRQQYYLNASASIGGYETPRDNVLSGPDPETMRTVVDAVNEELALIKEALEISAFGSDQSGMADTLLLMSRVAETLAVLGALDLRQAIKQHVETLQQAFESGEIPRQTLSSAADEIVNVEQRLAIMAAENISSEEAAGRNQSRLHIDQAQGSVLREARNGLEQVKNAIVEYIASQWDKDRLTEVPELLSGIIGSLNMIPLGRPADILQGCNLYIRRELLEKSIVPEWKQLDTLADAISGIEYYIERLSGDRDDDSEMLLTLAEQSIASLGYDVPGKVTMPVLSTVVSESEPVQQSEPPVLDDPEIINSDNTTLDENLSGSGEDNAAEHLQIAAIVANKAPEEASDSEFTSPYHVGLETTEQTEPTDTAPDFSQQESAQADSQPVESEHSGPLNPESESEAEPATTIEDAPPGDDIDEEIIEIFVEEAGEVIEAIDANFPLWRENFDDMAALDETRRAFHTLKGSGRMVGANVIGEMAWSIESMLNRLIDGSIKPHTVQAELISRVRQVLPEFVQAFEKREPSPDPQFATQVAAWGDSIASGNLPAELLQPSDDDLPAESTTEVSEEIEDDDSDAVLWEIFGGEADLHLQVVEQFISEMEQAAPLYTPPSEAMQRALHTLKGSAHMADIYDIAALATPLERFAKDLRSYQIEIDGDILQLLKDGVAYTRAALGKIRAGAPAVIEKLEQYQARVAELQDIFIGPYARKQTETSTKSVDPQLLSIFMAEEMDLLIDADVLIKQWRDNPAQPDKLDLVIAELNTLALGASQANLPDMAGISRSLADLYSAANGDLTRLGDEAFDSLMKAHEKLLDMVDAVAAGQNQVPPEGDLLDLLRTYTESLNSTIEPAATTEPEEPSFEAAGADSDMPFGEEMVDIPDELANDFDSSWLQSTVTAGANEEEPIETDILRDELQDIVEELDEIAEELHAHDEAADTNAVTEEPAQTELPEEETETDYPLPEIDEMSIESDLDSEIIDIFLEEADELMEDIEQAVHAWSEDHLRLDSPEELKRALHTFKGGARLAGLMGLGDIAHDFETDIINLGTAAKINERFFHRVHFYQDQLLKGLEQVRSLAGEEALAPESPGVEAVEGPSGSEIATTESDNSGDGEEDRTSVAEVIPFAPRDNIPVVSGGTSPVQPTQGPGSSGLTSISGAAASPLQIRRSAPQEVVKISAELLEDLVNLAGETSISRGRMEEQMSEQGQAIEEMHATITRLQEQLRRLDIETEAQVVFRQEQLAETEDFDPLEMDRYSLLQQLSRSLTESASDLMDLKNTLSDKTRDTETLLLQQSRINTDLQEGLMRSRMVPFSRMVPRLRRIIRQVSTELNKNVNLLLDNVEGELDRTVLERMVAPLEHMLRNAVDHGIESPQQRAEQGKPAAGTIKIQLAREGGDVILRLIDDGRGIDLEKVKAKAIERGLMAAEANLSDRDIMQFILHAGFSTAENITQISGRGVGLDVVHSEIKQLGGAMSINSRVGEGTEFVVRLPFTVSVNRALMVRIGDDRYAIPLNTIEGIVRVSPYELEHYYREENARFEYAGEEYQVRYLGHLLNSDARPKLEGQVMPLPVVLVRTAQNAVAMQVDMLMGSREIVVKSLGPQFSTVMGVSGATVMGDGSVVVIIDPHAMIRQQAAQAETGSLMLDSVPEPEQREVKTVMVVDDSVTVRKVTGRFLEREGYEVITAKDGADALMQLQDFIPDVMLLDIEMPRMDGFEVAKNIRSSNRLKDIPIIMITSRTGEKHRQRAFSLGVNQYMGKPYQEELLLHNIHLVTGATEDSAADSDFPVKD